MEARIVKLETEQELIKQELDSYADALKENTQSIQELTKILVRHDEKLIQEQQDTSTRNAILTGIIVGVVILLVDGMIHII